MRNWREVIASVLGVGALAVAAAPWSAAAPITSDEWRNWLVQQQVSFVERTRSMPLAVDQRIVGNGESAEATVTVTGTVNADGSMRVELVSPKVTMTVLCTGPARCWARLGKGGDDRLWHRIPAHEVASLREPLPTQTTDLPAAATYTTEGSTGTVNLTVEGVIVRERVSFADGGYTEALRLSDASEGFELTMAKSLTPTHPVSVRTPSTAVVGAPLGTDLVPQLP